MNEEIAQAILKFIYTSVETTGVVPSQREIAEACYISKGSVSNYLFYLEELGWIGRHKGVQRGIYLKFEKLGQMFTS